MKITYKNDLNCSATHLKSGSTITTDAPIDNNGKGAAFSPTDLLCTSLATCIITTMAITAQQKNISFGEVEALVEKTMASDPRRVGAIAIHLNMGNTKYSEREKAILQNTASTCPVTRSLHPDIHLDIQFTFDQIDQ